MAAADLVVCRAGASTIAELSLMGKPCVLVPSPNVTNNHQEKNARVLERAGGAVVLVESGLTSAQFRDTVMKLIGDEERLNNMAQAMAKAALSGDFATAADLQIRLQPLIELLFCEVNPIPVKAAMKINYFDDIELIQEQAKRFEEQ
jgi:UDP-N-acetylglucosamine--N-acetylmuramyl-(pentapeptide) pyrophosphoryl-undecaprenol N-acetylglucosamine transferase